MSSMRISTKNSRAAWNRDWGPLAAAYVLFLAVLGPILTRVVR